MDPIINGLRIIPIYIYCLISGFAWPYNCIWVNLFTPFFSLDSEKPTLPCTQKIRYGQQKYQSLEVYSPWINHRAFFYIHRFHDMISTVMVWNPKLQRFETLWTWYLKKRVGCWMFVCFHILVWFIYKMMGTWNIGISQSLMQEIGLALGNILAYPCCVSSLGLDV